MINHTWDFLGHPCMPLKTDRIFSRATKKSKSSLVHQQYNSGRAHGAGFIYYSTHSTKLNCNGQWRAGVSPEDIEARFYVRWLTKTKKEIYHYTNQGSLSTSSARTPSSAWDSSQLLAHVLLT